MRVCLTRMVIVKEIFLLFFTGGLSGFVTLVLMIVDPGDLYKKGEISWFFISLTGCMICFFISCPYQLWYAIYNPIIYEVIHADAARSYEEIIDRMLADEAGMDILEEVHISSPDIFNLINRILGILLLIPLYLTNIQGHGSRIQP